jgi:hypothetical protein
MGDGESVGWGGARAWVGVVRVEFALCPGEKRV